MPINNCEAGLFVVDSCKQPAQYTSTYNNLDMRATVKFKQSMRIIKASSSINDILRVVIYDSKGNIFTKGRATSLKLTDEGDRIEAELTFEDTILKGRLAIVHID